MPFLAPVFAFVSGLATTVAAWAAASPILAGIAQTAFGLALKYAVNALFPPKAQSRASQLETEYGANIPRSVILGTVGTAGHHIYRNNYGSGGRYFQDVYVLASFKITGVPRVRYNGKWRTLNQKDSDGYWIVPNEGTSSDDNDNVKVKFYYGSMNQQAEPTLINMARPSSRWTNKHRGAGVAYAIVFSELTKNGDGITSPAKLFFEVKGAPLYDWRKDSTVGGSGLHRWDDQGTWEYSDNPVVQIYNLERGFYNGNQLMVGKGTRASRLPLSEYTIAANICDEYSDDGSRRYRAHAIAKDGPGANHDANITPILEAMCATWVERVTGVFPIVGAPQAIATTITDDDIKVGAPLRYTAKRTRTELINTVASSYVSPDDFYEAKDAATRIDAVALAEDGETLASAIPFSAVTDVRQVDRLADIAIRGARFQASAEITIHPKFNDVIKEGRWITWASKKYGTKTYQVLSRQLGGHNSDGVRDITLHLQEIGNGVFDPTDYETIPPTIIVIDPPQWLASVENFRIIPTLVQADGGSALAGARLLWNAIDDISVIGVNIEYWPANDPTQVFQKFVSSDISVVDIVEGLTSQTDWFVRTRLRVENGRAVVWTAAVSFTTLDAGSDFYEIDIDDFGEGVKGVLAWLSDGNRYAREEFERLSQLVSDQDMGNFLDKQQLRQEVASSFQKSDARYELAITTATGPGSAISGRIETVEARINDDISTAVDLLIAEIETVDGRVSANTASILNLRNQVDGDIAAAMQLLSTEIETVDGRVTANATSIQDLTVEVNGVRSSVTMRSEAHQSSEDGWAVWGVQVMTGAEDEWSSAAFYVQTKDGVSRIAFDADQVIFTNGVDSQSPMTFINGELTLQVANIGIAYFDQLQSRNGKIRFRGYDDFADMRLFT